MTLKLLGSFCIILSCGGFGYYLAWQYLNEEKHLQQLIRAFEYMECNLQYQLTSLPKLLHNCAKEASGVIASILHSLATQLEQQIAFDANCCMQTAISSVNNIPALTKNILLDFGKQLGQYDLVGQLQCLAGLKRTCYHYLDILVSEKQARLRRFKTLGLCVGVGLVIIFI